MRKFKSKEVARIVWAVIVFAVAISMVIALVLPIFR